MATAANTAFEFYPHPDNPEWVWVTNAETRPIALFPWSNYWKVGPPKPSDTFTIDDLKKTGLQGWYTKKSLPND